MNALRLIAVLFRIGILSEIAYRANFYVQLFQSLLNLATAFGGVAVIFYHTETLGGWQRIELIALLGVFFFMGGVIGLVIEPSMARFMEDVRLGTLDFTLTKPADAQFLVSIGEMRVWKLVDLLMGFGVFALAIVKIGSAIGVVQAMGFALALMAGMAIVYSFWMLLSTFAFWFVRVENIQMIFQSLYDAGRWPIGIYPDWLRAALTFLVPVAFAVTIPSEALLGRLTWYWLAATIALAAILLAAARRFWVYGVRFYSGASA